MNVLHSLLISVVSGDTDMFIDYCDYKITFPFIVPSWFVKFWPSSSIFFTFTVKPTFILFCGSFLFLLMIAWLLIPFKMVWDQHSNDVY